MKNKTLFRLIAILFAMAIFTSCSKDSSILQSKDNASKTGISNKFGPVYSSGVMGELTPAPTFAEIKLYIEDRVSFQIVVNPDGTFKSSYIPPGVYNMLIAYIPAISPDDSKWSYYEINKVEILADVYTDLGQIKLP
jgi:hypothetical protein